MNCSTSCQSCISLPKTGLHLVTPEALQKISTFKLSHKFQKGDVIFNQGSPLSQVYCIRSGLVKIETISERGHSLTVGYAKGGDLLGLSSVLSHAQSTVTATAIEPTEACSFTNELFHSVLSSTPTLALEYMKNMLEDLRKTRQRLLSGFDKDVSSRVAEALIYLKANYPDHKFTRKEIAEWAGTTTESVIRTLGQFEEDNIIKQEGRLITISDSSKLQQLAGFLL